MPRCPVDHAALRAAPLEEWALATENERGWEGEGIVIAECRKCHTTIAREIEPKEKTS